MTQEELNKASLIVYMTDGNRDEYIAGDWSEYVIEDNYLKISNKLDTLYYFQIAIYNMNCVEKVVVSL